MESDGTEATRGRPSPHELAVSSVSCSTDRLAERNLLGQGLHDLGTGEEAVEVGQNQHRRTVGAGQGTDGADRGQRVAAPGVGGVVLARDLQSLLDVPGRQPPVLLAAELGDFVEGIFVLVTFDPQAGEAGRDVLGQTLRKLHGEYLLVGWWNGWKR